ncbi:TPA: hypothetical protein NH733_004246 [Pseudomonas aeruginosa]|uniref:hypothetical protein n=1 Tax=Pseudomonas aeruginosa TaxID=287 RepID=UPI000D528DFE|nr:hypothetical protein [Pseudomonas aeruginosa]HCF0841959.1 hypothetical protein [Pseudomonas aeruginosa]
MSNCPHEAWDFGALQCPDCGAVKDHVTDAEYAKLAAEAQALREEVAKLTQYNKSLDEENTRLLADCEKTDKEVAALRARVVVVPERELFTQYLPGAIPRNADEVSAWKEGWNACLDELARLNGKTVSEGLLRRIVTPALTSSDAHDRIGALEELRALLSEQDGGKP